jgi:hypothetical protein
MTLPRLAPVERTALQHFVAAVRAFSDDPGPANLERYLVASRELEESRRSRQTPPQAGRRTGGSSVSVGGDLPVVRVGYGAMQRWSDDATRGDLP